VILADGAEEAYDVLLVATGGKPEIPPALRKEHPAILPFDSLEDTLRIADRVPRSGTVAVYGPGFLAIVASSALRKRGNNVVWFQPDLPHPGYPISGELEANILDSVRTTGVRILDGQDIVTVREAGGESRSNPPKKERRSAASPSWWPPSVFPAIGFLSGSGVKTGTGIVVDDYLRTSVPNIYAAGGLRRVVRQGDPGLPGSTSGGGAPSSRGASPGRTWRGREAVRSRGVGLLLGPVRPRPLGPHPGSIRHSWLADP